MIWGMILKPGDEWTLSAECEKHFTLVSLECRHRKVNCDEKLYSHLYLKLETRDHMVCTLQEGLILQQTLDIVMQKGDSLIFVAEGNAPVYLSGYSDEQFEDEIPATDLSAISSDEGHSDDELEGVRTPNTDEKTNSHDNDEKHDSGHKEDGANPNTVETNTSDIKGKQCSHHDKDIPSCKTDVKLNNQDNKGNCVSHHGEDVPKTLNSQNTKEKHDCLLDVQDALSGEEHQQENHMKSTKNKMKSLHVVLENLSTTNEGGPDTSQGTCPGRSNLRYGKRRTADQRVSPSISDDQQIIHSAPKSKKRKYKKRSVKTGSHDGTSKTYSPSLLKKSGVDIVTKKGDDSNTPSVHRTKSGSSFPCDNCSQDFPSRKLLSKHFQTCEKNAIEDQTGSEPEEPKLANLVGYKCNDCEKVFTKKCLWDGHRQIHSSKKSYRCEICSNVYLEKNRKRHEETHRLDSVYKCDLCSKSFTTTHQLMVHQVGKHLVDTYKCTMCTKRFTSKWLLSAHMTYHRKKCPFCDQVFAENGQFKDHITTHEREKCYRCKVCGVSFSDRNSYYKHQATHEGERPCQCAFCEKSYKHIRHVIEHEKIHLDSSLHCQFCGKELKSRSALNVHEMIHKGLKPYKCKVCGKGHRQRCKLRAHERLHECKTILG